MTGDGRSCTIHRMTLTHDAMLNLRLDERPEESLRMALAFLTENAADHTAWYLAASLCVELGEARVGIQGLAGVGEEFAESGNLPMALVCIREIDGAGGDASDLRGLVTILYGKGSGRVQDRVLPPPPLPSAVDEAKLENFRPEKGFLVGEADRIMASATESAKLGRTMSERRPAVPYFPMFGALGPAGFLRLLDAFEIRRFWPGDTLMEQGKPSDEMYLLARGEVNVHMLLRSQKRKDLAVLGPGALLGEMGIVARTPRSATVEARTGGIALVASIDEIEKIAEDLPEVADVIVTFCEIRLLENLMSISPILHPLAPAERARVVRMFDRLFVDPGQEVIHEGEDGKGIWLVVSGEMAVVREPQQEEELRDRLPVHAASRRRVRRDLDRHEQARDRHGPGAVRCGAAVPSPGQVHGAHPRLPGGLPEDLRDLPGARTGHRADRRLQGDTRWR